MRDAPIDPETKLTSLHRYTWWSLTGTTAFFLVVIVGEWILDTDVPALARALSALALTVTVAAAVALFGHRLVRVPADAADKQRGRVPLRWLIAGMVGAAMLGGVILADGNYRLWSYAPATMVSITATFLPTRQRRILVAVAAAGAGTIGGVVALASGDDLVAAVLYPVGLVIGIAWITLGILWSWDVVERLNEARLLSAELAVKDERLRFAADLHDIQGHHLQVIALKGELAARLVERDPKRAATEMKEVQRLATDALQDTRAVVQGYRRTTLDDEITNATRVLAAADIDARMDVEPDTATDHIGAGGRHLLGLVMREATTNVLRHSRARHAAVEYRVTEGLARLRVSNDGAVGGLTATAGTGLPMLAERLAAAGGELTWKHDGDRFVVAASLPLGASAEAG